MTADTKYANTDFDLKSESPFDSLIRELEPSCCVLHYTQGDDNHWHSIVESSHDDENSSRDAAKDILAIIEGVNSLSAIARAELDSCYLREFNVGFHCWDTWGYVHTIPRHVVEAVAKSGCSIAITLYPMRNPDGTPKE